MSEESERILNERRFAMIEREVALLASALQHTAAMLERVNSTLNRLMWLAITGIVGALLSLVLKVPALASVMGG